MAHNFHPKNLQSLQVLMSFSITSSPRFPQSYGQVERFVKTMKAMMSKSEDLYLALLSYRSTPLPWCSLSPAELCMGRKIRTTIPQSNQLLIKFTNFQTETSG